MAYLRGEEIHSGMVRVGYGKKPNEARLELKESIAGSLSESEQRLLGWLITDISTKELSNTQTETVDPWIPGLENAEVAPERRQFVSKGLHILSDERRIILLALIGMNPKGTNGNEISKRLSHLSIDRDIVDRRLNDWIVNNNLATFVDRKAAGINHSKLTKEGLALLPFAGHLLDWAISAEEPFRDVLGIATKAVPETEEMFDLSIRPNFEQLKVLDESCGEKIRIEDLLNVAGSSEGRTRRRLAHLEEKMWIVVVPGRLQPEESYPIFEPSARFDALAKTPTTPEEAFRDYIAKHQEEEPGPMSFAGLLYRRQYLTASRRARGPENFAKRVVVEYAKLVGTGSLRQIEAAKFKNFGFVLNPTKAKKLRDLVRIVEGAEHGLDGYKKEGIEKLAQCLSSSDGRLANRINDIYSYN